MSSSLAPQVRWFMNRITYKSPPTSRMGAPPCKRFTITYVYHKYKCVYPTYIYIIPSYVYMETHIYMCVCSYTSRIIKMPYIQLLPPGSTLVPPAAICASAPWTKFTTSPWVTSATVGMFLATLESLRTCASAKSYGRPGRPNKNMGWFKTGHETS